MELIFFNPRRGFPLAGARRPCAGAIRRGGPRPWAAPPGCAGTAGSRKPRAAAAGLLGAELDEIAFAHNTTHGLLCVANSLPWRPGGQHRQRRARVPRDVHPWRNLAERGVALRVSPSGRIAVSASTISSATSTPAPRLVAVSLVQYSTGFRMPVEALAEVCRQRGILLLSRRDPGLGALPVRVGDLGCDFPLRRRPQMAPLARRRRSSLRSQGTPGALQINR